MKKIKKNNQFNNISKYYKAIIFRDVRILIQITVYKRHFVKLNWSRGDTKQAVKRKKERLWETMRKLEWKTVNRNTENQRSKHEAGINERSKYSIRIEFFEAKIA